MKKLILLLFIPLVSFGQISSKYNTSQDNFVSSYKEITYDNFGKEIDSEIRKKCNMDGGGIIPSVKIDPIIDRILDIVGISKRFHILPCSYINNGWAEIQKGIRIIVYDPMWFDESLSHIAIIAHEIGHHLNGHTINNLSEEEWHSMSDISKVEYIIDRRLSELECDKFAGSILYKLGYKESELLSADMFKEFSVEPRRFHPARMERIKAYQSGFKDAERIFKDFSLISENGKKDELLYSSIEKFNNEDIDGAYSDFLAFRGTDNDSLKKEFNLLIKGINNSNYQGRCSAITKSKTQCKRSAKIDSFFCWQHNDINLSDASIGRCSSTTKTGTQCKRKASDDKGFCWQHNDFKFSDSSVVKCSAITKAGTQCKRNAEDDREFCWQH